MLKLLRANARLVMAALFSVLAVLSLAERAKAQQASYGMQEVIDRGHEFFGATSGSIATVIEQAFKNHGQPNGYILGQEGSGAIIAGATFGEGTLYTRNAGDHPVYWQGPSIGWDYGGEGSRTMMLVYDLQSVPSLYRRYYGVAGSAYVVAGAGMTVLKGGSVLLVPIRTGVGARFGINVGYLKLTSAPTWNPF